MRRIQILIIITNLYRCIPGYIIFKHNKFHKKCALDLERWKKEFKMSCGDFLFFSMLVLTNKAFRNIVLNRLHRNPFKFLLFRILFKPLDSLYINMPPENIGGGFYIQHGFSTIIAANSIGENVCIHQQVTIGYKKNKCSIIGNNCLIGAGAIIIGDVKIGDNCIIGAGAVVTKDVKRNSVVAGVPAKLIKSFGN